MKQVALISAEEAAAKVQVGDTLLVGGFGMTGNPVQLVHALAESPETNQLTYVGNNVGEIGLGGGRLLRNGQLKKAIGSFFTSNREAVVAAQKGEIETELLPQGTLAEAIRAGGAGIGGFFTPTSAGTLLAQGRESKTLKGKEQIFQESIIGDVAFIRAWKADTAGNLQYRLTERNFNPLMATAAKVVIAEVQEIVAEGELDPDQIHTPGCFVDYLVNIPLSEEALGSSANVANSDKLVSEERMNMARAALAELKSGDLVNLGIGIPTLVADLITPDHGIILHSENGMVGVGPEPKSGGAMDYPVNAGKIPVTALPGSSYFDSADSFGMIRGSHVDAAIMGGLQVDAQGNLANWAVPGKPLLGVGGAMDLANGARRLIVTMTHTDKEGNSKLVERCNLPVTAIDSVSVIITDLAVFHRSEGKWCLTSLMQGVSLDEVLENTEMAFEVALKP
ncbi:3-oxoacid CoA-transferase [Vibrio crassostreae]|uniref:3-oxoacid CoA-transferase n=1 Tax=Vibrio crassostreae TaxID=246167 RepID=UPI000633B373|nr:3-oxoacid CoA-transferase [Vibrio crassostreae]CDT75743.1 putative succinyl-CoA:3-ketoacid coenzyme A transferase, mitochondrial [Vibrio crassostreae]